MSYEKKGLKKHNAQSFGVQHISQKRFVLSVREVAAPSNVSKWVTKFVTAAPVIAIDRHPQRENDLKKQSKEGN
jgi:hypothetical protein